MYYRDSFRKAATSPWLDPSYAPVDLSRVTTSRAAAFRAAAERAGLSLVIHCPNLPVPALVDRGSWETIVDTLVTNAISSTTAGQIVVSLYLLGHQFVLSVSDTGAGLAYADLPRVFSRGNGAWRAQPRLRPAGCGDLSLVQELARQHGGDAAVTSIEGQGSCFTVSIPIGIDREAAEAWQRRAQRVALTGD